MNIIYGFDDELMIKLIDFVKEKNNIPLTTVFREFALKTGKSSGTIRNLYYAIAKKAEADSNFKNTYLTGVKLSTNKIKKFTLNEERELIKNIMLERAKTRSTRSAVFSLSNGNSKQALRFQNKFRSALKNNRALIDDVSEEIRRENGVVIAPLNKVNQVTELNIEKVRYEINKLVERISDGVKKENKELKKQLAELREENEKLKLITSSLKGGGNLGYFKTVNDN